MNTIIEQNRQIEYVIGIDLGHGETSAAYCPIQWGEPVGQLESVKDLDLPGNEKKIPSAITILERGAAYIGVSAFNLENIQKAQVHVCFKKIPEDINGEEEQLMIRFMKEVYKSIRQLHPARFSDSNHLVFIATPSGWNKAAQDLYYEMAQKAGLPIGGVTMESRAAFIHALREKSSGVRRNMDNGAIVFDMGSSTLDFTYLRKGESPIDHGYNCGASFIEKEILAEAEKTNSSISLFKERYPDLYDKLLFEAREFKEQVYFDTSLQQKKKIDFYGLVPEDEDEDYKDIRLNYAPGELDAILEDAGYVWEVKKAMKDFRAKFIPGKDIHGVFMTGGASRMGFLKGLITECWGVNNEHIFRDDEPSLTISRGVAEVARMDMRTKGLDAELDGAIQELRNSDEIYKKFVKSYGEHMFESVRDGVHDCFIEFRDSSVNKNLYDLQNDISSKVRNIISEESQLTTVYMDDAIASCTASVREKVENIVREYASQGLDSNMDIINVPTPTIESIDLDNIMQEISNKIYEQSASWGELIGGAAIGGLIGFLFPVLGIAAAAYIFGKDLLFPKSEEEKKREAMSKQLDLAERKKVFESLEQNWDQMKTDMRKSVFNALTSDQRIVGSINETAKELLSAYRENLIAARRLID